MRLISFDLRPELLDALDEFCRNTNTPRAGAIRRAIYELLEKNGVKLDIATMTPDGNLTDNGGGETASKT